MKNGYDQFFKDARKAAGDTGAPVKFAKKPQSTRLHLDLSSEDVEQQLRRRMKMSAPKKKQKKSGVHWKMAGISFMGLLLAVVGFQNHEQIDEMLKRVEITLTGQAIAETAPAKKAAPKAEEKKAEAAPAESEAKSAALSSDEIDHLTKLNDRRKELDAREEELNRQEAELQAQKVELDKRLKELQDMRGKISNMLEDRVKADDQKVDTLVQMYTNMKAPQAAKVFETMDEDLVVEILGRMKKKNAADIMNLLKPEKAQTISEKYAGYKRAPASEK
ncbi:magnesium transporter MgtE N-terminal domain-containing protein [Bdellovibrio sp. HCB209]|uniref:magnesium transporter MgtE N-terminal domain-containing protein n=1 Tax=Bdellovibrio sp. HCB209 TaxID=3394354 RepID=UPI0039B6A398